MSHDGPAFRNGNSLGVSVPGQGGAASTLRNTRAGGQFSSEPLPLSFPATHAGLHWTTDGFLPELLVELRWSRDGQRWSPWRETPVETHGRDRTDDATFSTLIALRGATWLQYRLTFGAEPGSGGVANLGVAYLDAGRTRPELGRPSGIVDQFRASARRGPADLLDRVITREQWGADESIRFSAGQDLWPRAFVTPKVLVVHHTATENEYADPAAEIRAIYAYHTTVQGFGDIGHHLLIDNRGQVYEGRRGREADSGASGSREIVSASIVGGHTLGYNYGSAGIALLGDFTDVAPTEAAVASLTEVLTFEARRHGLEPTARTDLLRVNGPDGSDSLWRDDLAVVSGHRDCIETECPGGQLYAQLPTIRAAVAGQLGAAGPTTRIIHAPTDRNSWPTDLVFAWEGGEGAAEYSTRLEGFARPSVPDLITPLSGYTEDQRELWSPWSAEPRFSVALPLETRGSFTLWIRARDQRGRIGRVHEHQTLFIDRHVLVDNLDIQRTRRTGAWRSAATVLNFNGVDYEEAEPAGASASFTWLLRSPFAGQYRVQVCWSGGEVRASNAEYRALVHGEPRFNVTMDQRNRGGTWVDLGRVTLNTDELCELVLTNAADSVVAADAARILLIDA
ncbi:MAG: N-acetylmuramoyl-L-alanine amidase [Chloroflexota bacterium]